MPVISIRKHNWIVWVYCSDCSNRNSFLPNVDMAKAANKSVLVCLHSTYFKFSNEEHLP